MTITSLQQDIANNYEGHIGTIEVKSYCCEFEIDGDSENMLIIHYKNGHEIKRSIEPKMKPFKWES